VKNIFKFWLFSEINSVLDPFYVKIYLRSWVWIVIKQWRKEERCKPETWACCALYSYWVFLFSCINPSRLCMTEKELLHNSTAALNANINSHDPIIPIRILNLWSCKYALYLTSPFAPTNIHIAYRLNCKRIVLTQELYIILNQSTIQTSVIKTGSDWMVRLD
jgi:hypothetical protein